MKTWRNDMNPIHTPGESISSNEVLDQILRDRGTSLKQEKERIAAARAAEKAEKEQRAQAARDKAEFERVWAIDEKILDAFEEERLIIAIDGKVLETPDSHEALHSIRCQCGAVMNGSWDMLRFALEIKRPATLSLMGDNAELAPSTLVYTVQYLCPKCGKDSIVVAEARQLYPDGYRGMMLELARAREQSGRQV